MLVQHRWTALNASLGAAIGEPAGFPQHPGLGTKCVVRVKPTPPLSPFNFGHLIGRRPQFATKRLRIKAITACRSAMPPQPLRE